LLLLLLLLLFEVCEFKLDKNEDLLDCVWGVNVRLELLMAPYEPNWEKAAYAADEKLSWDEEGVCVCCCKKLIA